MHWIQHRLVTIQIVLYIEKQRHDLLSKSTFLILLQMIYYGFLSFVIIVFKHHIYVVFYYIVKG